MLKSLQRCLSSGAKNPFLPLDIYIPDGEPKVFDGRVYLYGSKDELTESIAVISFMYIQHLYQI